MAGDCDFLILDERAGTCEAVFRQIFFIVFESQAERTGTGFSRVHSKTGAFQNIRIMLFMHLSRIKTYPFGEGIKAYGGAER